MSLINFGSVVSSSFAASFVALNLAQAVAANMLNDNSEKRNAEAYNDLHEKDEIVEVVKYITIDVPTTLQTVVKRGNTDPAYSASRLSLASASKASASAAKAASLASVASVKSISTASVASDKSVASEKAASVLSTHTAAEASFAASLCMFWRQTLDLTILKLVTDIIL